VDKPNVRQLVQRSGEDLAEEWLRARGYRTVARNWRIKLGEIDLICMHGDTLVFVEVKARMNDDFGGPELSVGFRKQQKLRRVAEAYLHFKRPRCDECRFDVVAVSGGFDRPEIKHFPNAF
jgi:putative endonuclease